MLHGIEHLATSNNRFKPTVGKFSLDGASGIGLDWIEMMKSYCRYTSPMDPRGNRYVFSNFVKWEYQGITV